MADNSKFKIVYAIPHVTLFYTSEDKPLLRIEDTEVFNVIDDILIEQYDIENYHRTEINERGISIYTMSFPDYVDKTKLIKAIKNLEKDGITKVFKMNNY